MRAGLQRWVPPAVHQCSLLDRRLPFLEEPRLRSELLLQIFYGLVVPHLRSTTVKFELFINVFNDRDVQEME